MTIKIATAFLFYLFYWFCCFLGTGTDKKNLAGLRSYPDAVQAAVRKHPVLGKAVPQEKSMMTILLGNLLLFTVAFSVLSCLILWSLTCYGGGTGRWNCYSSWLMAYVNMFLAKSQIGHKIWSVRFGILIWKEVLQ